MNFVLKCVTGIFICSMPLIADAQTGESENLKQFRKHCARLLEDGGKWKATNKDYNAAEEWSARYLGYEFKKGINDNTMLLKITGYFPKKSQWMVFWDGFYTWDHQKQKAVYHSVNTEGAIATGESESVSENEMVLVFNTISPDGKIEKHKDVEKLVNNSIESNSFKFKNNKWEPNNSMTWTKLGQPTGNLTFMSTRDGNWEIYSMDTKGENLKNLSCNKAADYMFSYFPESNRFVYYSNRDGNDEIYIMSADGKKQTNISNHPSGDRVATVSPTGNQILFLSDRDSKDGEIYIMDTLGNDVKRLTHNDLFEDLPVFSPDGKKIMFTRTLVEKADSNSKTIYNGEIFLMNLDGTNEVRLTNRPGGDGGAQISPDGGKIAFHGRSSEGKLDIHIMDIDGKNIVNITNDDAEDYSPSWSPDGKWIAYTSGDSKNYDVWIINLETGIKTRLTTQPKRDESPVWQPVF